VNTPQGKTEDEAVDKVTCETRIGNDG